MIEAEDYREALMLLQGKVQTQNMRPMDVMAWPGTVDRIRNLETHSVEEIYMEKINLVRSPKCDRDVLTCDDGEQIKVKE